MKQQGIGHKLVTRILEELDGVYMIDMMCDEGRQPYYDKFGMIKSWPILSIKLRLPN